MKGRVMRSSGELLARAQRKRLAEDLWELVRFPSPAQQERQVALAFADILKTAGAEVEIDETFPDSSL